MPRHLKTQFVVADGARARWVKRSDRANDFVTEREIEAEPLPSGQPKGVVYESSAGRPFNVEERHDAVRQHHERFACKIAEVINAQAATEPLERLAVVAPSRVLSVINRRLSGVASAKLAKTLAKDLTKVPDHELGTWLRDLEFG